MKHSVLFLIFIAVCATSCSVESITECPSGEIETPSEQISLSQEISSNGFRVTPSMLNKYLNLFCKNKTPESIDVIIDDGDTLAYYVQYGNNRGWDLIAADTRIEPVLSAGSSSSMNALNEDAANVAMGSLKSVKDVKSSANFKESPSWTFVRPSQIRTKQNRSSFRGLAEGMWIPIDTVFAYDTIAPNRIIATKWGQGYPWDQYTPLDPDYYFTVHTFVGCVPVAVGQILYRYLYLTNGIYDIPDVVTFDNTTGLPQFVSFTTDWSNMAKDSTNYTSAEKIKTAKFLSWLGYQMNTTYRSIPPGSSTVISEAQSLMSNYLNFDSDTTYHSSVVMSNLMNNMPVYISANSNNGQRHSFIIDGYKIIRYQVVIRYQFDPHHLVTEDDYYNFPSWMFEWPNMIEFPGYDPDKDPAIKPIATTLFENTFLLMNWGYNGNGDDVMYSSYSTSNWGYSQVKKMFYNFQRKNQ